MTEEIWKDIEGYEGFYSLSDSGIIYSEARQVTRISRNGNPGLRIVGGLIKKPFISKKGYKIVTLERDGIGKSFLVHRLVAELFIPNPENKPCVNHKDGNKLNNDVDNLEWCTYSENADHAYKTGLSKVRIGSEASYVILDELQVRCIKSLLKDKFLTHKQIAGYFNVCRQTISSISRNKIWKHISI